MKLKPKGLKSFNFKKVSGLHPLDTKVNYKYIFIRIDSRGKFVGIQTCKVLEKNNKMLIVQFFTKQPKSKYHVSLDESGRNKRVVFFYLI